VVDIDAAIFAAQQASKIAAVMRGRLARARVRRIAAKLAAIEALFPPDAETTDDEEQEQEQQEEEEEEEEAEEKEGGKKELRPRVAAARRRGMVATQSVVTAHHYAAPTTDVDLSSYVDMEGKIKDVLML
jgi:hypothetical protein